MGMTLKQHVRLLFFLGLLLAGCSSATIINSEPQGAKVIVDGVEKGVTPYTYSDRKTIGSTTNILLKKEGYEDYNMLLVRNEEFDAAACAGGVFTLIPFLWIQKYSPERTLELVGLEGTDEIDESPDPTPTPAPTASPVPEASSGGVKVKVAPVKPAKPAPKPKSTKAPKAAKPAKGTKPAAKSVEPKAAEPAKPGEEVKPAEPAKPEPAAAPSEAPKQ
jgi:hypothetical protein